MDKALENAISAAGDYGVTDAELATVVEAATATKRAVADADPGRVVIGHPALHRQMLVDPDSVPVYEASGWQVKAADAAPDDADPAASAAPVKPAKAAAKKETP